MIIPFFLAFVLVILIRGNQISHNFLAAGLVSFVVTSVPIGLLILINLLKLNTIKIGLVTIPLLPAQPRFESETGGLLNQFFPTLGLNIWNLTKLLFTQNDGIIYNAFEPYGYFYAITFPLAILGVVLLVRSLNSQNESKILLLLVWLGAPLFFGAIQPVNINRINIIFIPILICIAVSIAWLKNIFKPIYPISICSFILAFIAFTFDYHGSVYMKMADIKFHTGLLSAIQYADTIANGQICLTSKIDMPYIYVLFAEKPDPASYLNTIQYFDATDPFRQVRSLLRYTFGKQNCSVGTQVVYVLTSDEIPPPLGNRYKYEFFDNFVVYFPKP